MEIGEGCTPHSGKEVLCNSCNLVVFVNITDVILRR